MRQFTYTYEGEDDNDIRIIGVELAIQNPMAGEQELEMFSCKHTVRDGRNFNIPKCVRLTLHTSAGDRTAYISLLSGAVSNQRVF